jgi:hypothetical protein
VKVPSKSLHYSGLPGCTNTQTYYVSSFRGGVKNYPGNFLKPFIKMLIVPLIISIVLIPDDVPAIIPRVITFQMVIANRTYLQLQY